MATTPDQHYANKFNTNYIYKCQQEESRMQKACMYENMAAEYDFFNVLSTVDSTAISSRSQATAENTVQHLRRRVGLSEKVITRYIDRRESLKMVGDPTHPYVTIFTRRKNRDIDDIIIAAAAGTAYTDKTGSTSTSYDTDMTVASGTTGLTKAKIKAAKKNLDANESPDEGRWLFIGSEQVSDIIDDSTLSNIDYMEKKTVPDGVISKAYGFNIVRSERLTTTVSGVRDCLYWQSDGMLFAEGKDTLGPETIISLRGDLNNLRQIQTYYHIGATRLDEELVGIIECIED